MSNPAIKLVAGLAIVGALGVGLPWVIGQKIETDVRAAIAAAPDHYPYPVSLVRYERGLFSSVAETRHDLDLGPDADDFRIDDDGKPVLPPNRIVPLTVLHRITHGPWLDGLRLARVVNTVALDGEWREAARRVFGDVEPATLTVDIGLAGGLSGELLSPAVDTRLSGDGDGGGRHLQWSGISGRFRQAGDHLLGTLEAPGLDLDDGAFAMGPVAVKTDLTMIADGIWTGRFDSSFASFGFKGPAGAASMTGMRLDSETADSAGKLKSTATLSISELQFNDTRVRDARLRMVLDQFGTRALSDLSRALNRYNTQQSGKPVDSDEMQRLLVALKPSLAAVAADKPVFAIEDLSFTAPQGALAFSGKVQYVGDANLDDFAAGTDVAAEARLAAPLALIDLLLQLQAASTVIPGPDGEPIELSPEQLASAVQTSRDAAIVQGLLRIDGDRASTVVEFKAGALTVNGRPLGAPPI